jgi:DNA-binding GntR family transcriptional regulator
MRDYGDFAGVASRRGEAGASRVRRRPVDLGCQDLYERVECVLAGDVADGSLPPETQLPSEDGLVERLKVSRTTVRKAIQNLVDRGLVEVRRGKGISSRSRRSRRS